MFADGIDIGRLLEFLVLIDSLFDEDLLQRQEMQLFQEFVLADFEFLADKVFGAVCGVAEHVAHREELRFVVLDHTTVG